MSKHPLDAPKINFMTIIFNYYYYNEVTLFGLNDVVGTYQIMIKAVFHDQIE